MAVIRAQKTVFHAIILHIMTNLSLQGWYHSGDRMNPQGAVNSFDLHGFKQIFQNPQRTLESSNTSHFSALSRRVIYFEGKNYLQPLVASSSFFRDPQTIRAALGLVSKTRIKGRLKTVIKYRQNAGQGTGAHLPKIRLQLDSNLIFYGKLLMHRSISYLVYTMSCQCYPSYVSNRLESQEMRNTSFHKVYNTDSFLRNL